MTSLLLLMRCATGENWNYIMAELANTEGYNGVDCVENQTYQDQQRDGIKGCGTAFSYAYFITF